jgi:hypothetical protein
MRKVFLDDLPRKGTLIDWKNSLGMVLQFQFDNIFGYFKIIDRKVRGQRGLDLLIEYENKVHKIDASRLKSGQIGTIIGVHKSSKIIQGKNDISTLRPDMVKIFEDKDLPYKVGVKSGRRANFICPQCNLLIKNKVISNISIDGLFCARCSDGISYPEKIVYHLLDKLEIDFIKEMKFTWSNARRYDFYIPSLNLIIEVHGAQHFRESNGKWRNEKNIDESKLILAKDNKILNYIIIDARNSEIEYIKKQIFYSGLGKLFDLNNIDWNEIDLLSQSSFMLLSCKMRKKDNLTPQEIANRLNLARTTIGGYLRRGNKLGLCEYDGKKESQNARIKSITRSVVCVDKNEIFNSIKDASLSYGLTATTISGVCRGVHKTAGGFRWMYKEDYDKYIKQAN